MEMKIKKTIMVLAVCMLVFVSFSAVMVYAPPPSDVLPFQNVIVTNTDPIPVEVSNDPLDVTLDEPIEVMGMETTYWSTDTTSIDPSDSEQHWVSTEGYKEITLFIENDNGDAVSAGLKVICAFRIFNPVDITVDGPSDVFTMAENRFAITYKIISNQFFFNLVNPSSTETVENLEYGYYLTT